MSIKAIVLRFSLRLLLSHVCLGVWLWNAILLATGTRSLWLALFVIPLLCLFWLANRLNLREYRDEIDKWIEEREEMAYQRRLAR